MAFWLVAIVGWRHWLPSFRLKPFFPFFLSAQRQIGIIGCTYLLIFRKFASSPFTFVPMRIITLFLFLSVSLLSAQPNEANLLGRWQDTTLVGSNIHKNVYNEIWGYAIPDHEYAIIGTTAGTHFIEVTDPTQPTEVFFVPGAEQGGVIIHRDYHNYKGYLYAVSDEGNSTLQIIDLQQLPDTVTVVYDSDTLIKRNHNIFIDTTQALLYGLISRGGVTDWAAMTVFDISNPVQPVFLQEYNQLGGMPITQVHDAYFEDNIGFLNLGPQGFAIADFSDPTEAVLLSTLTDYPDRGYNHSGWLSANCSHYYMADETHGFDMKALEVNDLCNPEVVGQFNAAVTSPTSIVHNQVVACNYLYTSYYYDGLRVYDISDPSSPELALFYDTYPDPDGRQFRGAWGVYPFLPSGTILISDMQYGLFVFEGMGDQCHLQEKPVCSFNSSCIEMITSTEEIIDANSISVSPNPIGQSFWLSVNPSLTSSWLKVSLLDMSGQVIQQWDRAITDLNAAFLINKQLPSGLYFLSLQTDNTNWTKKVALVNDRQ